MELEAVGRLLPLVFVFGGVILTVGVFRLREINTFIDHRKTALRNQLRDYIARSPYLLVAVQRIGKVPELAQPEETLFASIHDAYGVLVREIQTLRERSFRFTVHLKIAFAAWLATCSGLVLVQTPAEQVLRMLPAVVIVTAIGLGTVYLLIRSLQPGVNRTTDPDELGGYLTKAAEELSGAPRRSGTEANSNPVASPAAIGLADLWGLQEAMLQSYRLLFATVESMLLVGASILLPAVGGPTTIALAALGFMLALIWIAVCRARARAVVFMHWLIRRAEAGCVVSQPYASLREFQDSRTHGAIRVLKDPDFRRLRSTVTGRRMDLHVPALFILAWVVVALLAIRSLVT